MDYKKELTKCQREFETLTMALNTAVSLNNFGAAKRIIEKQRGTLLRWICCTNVLINNGVNNRSIYDLYKSTLEQAVKCVLQSVATEKALNRFL